MLDKAPTVFELLITEMLMFVASNERLTLTPHFLAPTNHCAGQPSHSHRQNSHKMHVMRMSKDLKSPNSVARTRILSYNLLLKIETGW